MLCAELHSSFWLVWIEMKTIIVMNNWQFCEKKNCGMGTENVPISGAGGMCQRRRRSQFFFFFCGFSKFVFVSALCACIWKKNKFNQLINLFIYSNTRGVVWGVIGRFRSFNLISVWTFPGLDFSVLIYVKTLIIEKYESTVTFSLNIRLMKY